MKRSHKQRNSLKALERNPNRLEVWDHILASALQTIFDGGFEIRAGCNPDKDSTTRYWLIATANDVQHTMISAEGFSTRDAAQKIVKRLATLELLAGSNNMRQVI